MAMTLRISSHVKIPEDEIEISAVHAAGAGGQHVNKVATAIHLRFDIPASSLPDYYKQRLLKLKDRRISKEGVIVIKAQRSRSRDRNRDDAMNRLQALIRSVATNQRKRIPTKPSKRSQNQRLDQKTRRGRDKRLRGKVDLR